MSAAERRTAKRRGERRQRRPPPTLPGWCLCLVSLAITAPLARADDPPAAVLEPVGYVVTDELPHGGGTLAVDEEGRTLLVVVLAAPTSEFVPPPWRYEAIRAEERKEGKTEDLQPRENWFVYEASRFSILLADGRVVGVERVGLWGEILATSTRVEGWNLEPEPTVELAVVAGIDRADAEPPFRVVLDRGEPVEVPEVVVEFPESPFPF